MKFTFEFDWGRLKWANAPGENSNTSDFNKIKIILLMLTGSQNFYLRVYTN